MYLCFYAPALDPKSSTKLSVRDKIILFFKGPFTHCSLLIKDNFSTTPDTPYLLINISDKSPFVTIKSNISGFLKAKGCSAFQILATDIQIVNLLNTAARLASIKAYLSSTYMFLPGFCKYPPSTERLQWSCSSLTMFLLLESDIVKEIKDIDDYSVTDIYLLFTNPTLSYKDRILPIRRFNFETRNWDLIYPSPIDHYKLYLEM